MPWPNEEGLTCNQCGNKFPALLLMFVYDPDNPANSVSQHWCYTCVVNRGAVIRPTR